MKRSLLLLICFIILLGCAGCKNVIQHRDDPSSVEDPDIKLPKDFSFSITWGTNGISSYDSRSGKLVKTSDATDVSKYTAYVKMSNSELQTVYRCLFSDINIARYPDSYDPFNAPGAPESIMSEPNQTIIISVTKNGATKTVKCEKIAYARLDECYCDEAKAFLTAVREIIDLITSFPEWEAFPDYEFFYD